MARKRKGWQQGWFTPRHPEKYRGNPETIRYMSSWERHTHQFLDMNPNVLEWSSEEIAIPYIKPTDRRVHMYYPDYWVKYRNKYGEIVEEIWEVKPEKEVSKPKIVGRSKKQQLVESVKWAVNQAKWKAANVYCKKNNYKFRIMTESQLFK